MKNAVDEYQRLVSKSQQAGLSIHRYCISEGRAGTYASAFSYIAYLSNLAATLRRLGIIGRKEAMTLSTINYEAQDKVIAYTLSQRKQRRKDRIATVERICAKFPQVVKNSSPWSLKLLVDPIPRELWESHVWQESELGLPMCVEERVEAPLPVSFAPEGDEVIYTGHGRSVRVTCDDDVDGHVFQRVREEHKEFCQEPFTVKELEQFHRELKIPNHRVILTPDLGHGPLHVLISCCAEPEPEKPVSNPPNSSERFHELRDSLTEDYSNLSMHMEGGILPPEVSKLIFGNWYGDFTPAPKHPSRATATRRVPEPKPARPEPKPAKLAPTSLPAFQPSSAGINNQKVQAVAWVLGRINTLTQQLLNIPGTVLEEVTFHPGDFERMQALSVSASDTLTKFDAILATVRNFHNQ
jgi:hypothetical protein